MFYESSFVVVAFILKLRGTKNSYLFYVADLPVSAIIWRLDFQCFVGIYVRVFNTFPG